MAPPAGVKSSNATDNGAIERNGGVLSPAGPTYDSSPMLPRSSEPAI